MPIASGAADTVAARVEANRCTTQKDTNPKFCDSYLERYNQLKMRKKDVTGSLQKKQDHTDPGNEDDGSKEVSTQEEDREEDQASGKTSSEKKSKPSQLCVIL